MDQRALELLERVEIPGADSRLDAYPHQLFGGMGQRAAIAMAIAGEPQLLIADVPTTALDVTIQAQIMELSERRERVQAMMKQVGLWPEHYQRYRHMSCAAAKER